MNLKKYFKNKKGFSLIELMLATALSIFVFIIVLGNLSVYSYLIYPNVNFVKKITLLNLNKKTFEIEFAHASSIHSKDASYNSPWWNKNPVKISLQKPFWPTSTTGRQSIIDYEIGSSFAKRGNITLFPLSFSLEDRILVFNWYLLDGYNQVLATNDPRILLPNEVATLKIDNNIVAAFNSSANTATFFYAYFYTEDKIPFIVSSARLIQPVWRTANSTLVNPTDNYLPFMYLEDDGNYITFQCIPFVVARKITKFTDFNITSNSFTIKLNECLDDGSIVSGLSNKYIIAFITKPNFYMLAKKTDSDGNIEMFFVDKNGTPINNVDELFVYFLGDRDYVPCVYYYKKP